MTTENPAVSSAFCRLRGGEVKMRIGFGDRPSPDGSPTPEQANTENYFDWEMGKWSRRSAHTTVQLPARPGGRS
jgi:hypothetical protein